MKKDKPINSGTVLIVDDIPENLQVLGNILISKGLDVGFATNGAEALENVKFNPPDLILLDIMMPGMNGYEVCVKLKENSSTRDIPVIFLTAKTQPEDIIKGFEVGAVDYVTKPFNSGELLARVTTQLELKNSRDLIKRQNQELIELNATKDKFFSIISHDLRGPFSGLLGLTELISTDGDSMENDEIIDLTRKIHSTLRNQYNLLENLLQWANMQTQRFELRPQKVNLCQAFKDIATALQANALKKQITFVNSVPNNIFVFADYLMLRSILHNLISNAIKFTFDGGSISFDIELKGAMVLIKIKDTGVGMPDEVLSKLFRIDKYHSSVGTNNEKGTGLGLILCKEMVEKNKGKIWAERNKDVGSTFNITIPIYEELI